MVYTDRHAAPGALGEPDDGRDHPLRPADRRERANLVPRVVAGVPQAGRIDEGGIDIADMDVRVPA